MFPPLRQRFLILAALAVGLPSLLAVEGGLRAADLSSGITLLGPGGHGAAGVLLLILAALPALGAGCVLCVTGNPLSGPFALAAALMVLACRGGSIGGWMYRAHPPGSYLSLVVEALLWAALWIAALTVMQAVRKRLAARWPALASADHLGRRVHFGLPGQEALLAGLACLLVGGVVSYAFISNSSTGQVVGSVLTAFTLGGLAGQMLFPQDNPLVMLLSPAGAALAGYIWVLATRSHEPEVFAAWYGQRLPGWALVLPIHFFSAGVMGVALGIGWAQGMLHGDKPVNPTATEAGNAPNRPAPAKSASNN